MGRADCAAGCPAMQGLPFGGHTVLLIAIVLHCGVYAGLTGGHSIDPYPYLKGGAFGNRSSSISPDPMATYHWNFSSLAHPQAYQVFYDTPVEATEIVPCCDGLETVVSSQDTSCNVTVRANGLLRFKFAQESASWVQFDSPDLPEGVAITMTISENRLPAPDETGSPKKYNQTYRLELNQELYEGVRYVFMNITGACVYEHRRCI